MYKVTLPSLVHLSSLPLASHCPFTLLLSPFYTSPLSLYILPPPSLSHLLHTSPSQLAFKYLGWVLFPLFLCYGVYSLLYHEHKGWYSFLLSMSYGFLLTFGKTAAQSAGHRPYED